MRITDACGTLVAVYDPLYLRRFRPGTEPSAARRERAARRLVPATVRILAGLA